jgi:hypothetical protein
MSSKVVSETPQMGEGFTAALSRRNGSGKTEGSEAGTDIELAHGSESHTTPISIAFVLASDEAVRY